MTYDIIFHPEQDELAIDEALRRLVTSFPRIIVDRPRGIALRKSWGSNCGSFTRIDRAEYTSPNQEIRAAWVSIAVENDALPIELVLEHEMDFFIKHSSDECRQLRRPAIQQVANMLGYEVSEWPLMVAVRIESDDEMFKANRFIAEELTLNCRLGEALERYGLYTVERPRRHRGFITAEIVVHDDVIGTTCIQAAVLSVFPDAQLEFRIRPDARPRCV